jgi:hypothetical protein
MMPGIEEITRSRKLGVIRCAASGALSLAALFVLCWLGAAAGMING